MFLIKLFPPSSGQKKNTRRHKQQASHTNGRYYGKGTVGFVSFMSALKRNSRKKYKIRYVHFLKEAKPGHKPFSTRSRHYAQDVAAFMKETQAGVKNSVLKTLQR